ncbi:MAG: major capsid protein [Smithella sp.]|jgi:hypothetical protein
MAYTEGTIQSTNTLAGLLRINDANLSDVEFNDIIQPTEFMKVLPFVPASRGTQHSWTVTKTAPGFAFRELNTGVTNAAGTEQTILANLKLMDASFHRDASTVLSPRMTREQYLQRETMKSLNAALVGVEKQLILGTDEEADGFDGLADILDIWGDMGEDLGGAGGTRLYMLCLSPDRIAGVIGGSSTGQEGNIDVSDPYMTTIADDSGEYDAWRVKATGWMGLQIAGSYSGAVAFNIDGTTGKTIDDDLLAGLYTKFPTQHAPFVNCILMSRTGLKQLRDSMVTDLIPSPPFPVAWGGAGRPIPIVVSDAVDDSESTNAS